MVKRILTVTIAVASSLITLAVAQSPLAVLTGEAPQVQMNKDLLEDVASHFLASRLLEKTAFNLVKIRYCGVQASAGMFLAELSSSVETVAQPACDADFATIGPQLAVTGKERVLLKVLLSWSAWKLRINISDCVSDGTPNATALSASLKSIYLTDISTNSTVVKTPNSELHVAWIIGFLDNGGRLVTVPVEIAANAPAGLSVTDIAFPAINLPATANAAVDLPFEVANLLFSAMPDATFILPMSPPLQLKRISLVDSPSALVVQGMLDHPFKGWLCNLSYSKSATALPFATAAVSPTPENCSVYPAGSDKSQCEARRTAVAGAAKQTGDQLSQVLAASTFSNLVREGPYSITADGVVLSQLIKAESSNVAGGRLLIQLRSVSQ
jgi:hypothetical protein